MAFSRKNQLRPDYATHPGEILEETLEARGIKQSDFAKWCGLSEKTVSQIINRKAPVTPETAIQFERVLDIAAHIWTNLDSSYNLHIAQKKAEKKLKENMAWKSRFPIKELVARGIIADANSETDLIENLLKFFAVGSPEAWKRRNNRLAVSFRHSPSYKSAPESVAAWLRIGEIQANKINTKPYDKTEFISALNKIRKLTTQSPKTFEPQIKELCRNAGVALVFAYELPHTHLYGATRWLTSAKALIMLSLRQKSDDHFWFSFFHEAAHILLHGKRDVFLDEKETITNCKEEEANRFAKKILIPQDQYEAFVNSVHKKYFSKQAVCNFAQRIKLPPGVIVGRLQHDEFIGFNTLNGLKQKFELVEDRE